VGYLVAACPELEFGAGELDADAVSFRFGCFRPFLLVFKFGLELDTPALGRRGRLLVITVFCNQGDFSRFFRMHPNAVSAFARAVSRAYVMGRAALLPLERKVGHLRTGEGGSNQGVGGAETDVLLTDVLGSDAHKTIQPTLVQDTTGHAVAGAGTYTLLAVLGCILIAALLVRFLKIRHVAPAVTRVAAQDPGRVAIWTQIDVVLGAFRGRPRVHQD
jgi:hypothetical protein